MGSAVLHVPARAAAFDAALEGLTRVNETLLAARDYLPLYDSGVRYRKEAREVWRHVDDVYKEGWGDCEDLSAARAAELRVSGEDPDAAVRTYKSGPHRYHAIVLRGDGSIEDPSRALGMKGAPQMILEGDPDTIAFCEGLADLVLGDDIMGAEGSEADAQLIPDPTPAEFRVTVDVQPQREGGYKGVARVPLKSKNALVTTSSTSATKAQATKRALNLATKALDHPAAAALLPPQAKLALNLIKSPYARSVARGVGKLRKIF